VPLPPSADGWLLDGIVESTADPRLLAAAGLAFMMGAGGAVIPRGESFADSRLMMQLGLAFGLLYAVFLSVWFWATRLRAPRPGLPRGQ
jgi:hypothetical protein